MSDQHCLNEVWNLLFDDTNNCCEKVDAVIAHILNHKEGEGAITRGAFGEVLPLEDTYTDEFLDVTERGGKKGIEHAKKLKFHKHRDSIRALGWDDENRRKMRDARLRYSPEVEDDFYQPESITPATDIKSLETTIKEIQEKIKTLKSIPKSAFARNIYDRAHTDRKIKDLKDDLEYEKDNLKRAKESEHESSCFHLLLDKT